MDTTQNASTAVGALKYILTYLLTEFICLFIHNQRPHHGRTHYRGIFYSNIMWQNPLYRQHHSIVHDVLSISSVCTAPSLICFLRRRRRRRTTTTTTTTKMINYRPNQREAPTFSTGWGPHVVAAILSHQHFILCVCVCVFCFSSGAVKRCYRCPNGDQFCMECIYHWLTGRRISENAQLQLTCRCPVCGEIGPFRETDDGLQVRNLYSDHKSK